MTTTTSRPFAMDERGFHALPVAYALARSGPVVTLKVGAGQEWLIDFEDADGTSVVVGADGSALLGLAIPPAEVLTHYRAGHRTRLDGLGEADRCDICRTSEAAPGAAFTHPQWTPPEPELVAEATES